MLEVDAGDPKLEKSLENLLGEWLKDMGIEKSEVQRTRLPDKTASIIDNFINWKG